MSATLYKCYYCGRDFAPYLHELKRAEWGKPLHIRTCGSHSTVAVGQGGGAVTTTAGGCTARAAQDGYRIVSVTSR